MPSRPGMPMTRRSMSPAVKFRNVLRSLMRAPGSCELASPLYRVTANALGPGSRGSSFRHGRHTRHLKFGRDRDVREKGIR